MKTKTWIILLTLMLAVCVGLSIPFLIPGEAAVSARIRSRNQLIKTVDLRIDQEFTLDTPDGGYNVITVKDGKIAVTEANCPDHYCMERGFCNNGSAIVCLPNRLVIEFAGETEVDFVVG